MKAGEVFRSDHLGPKQNLTWNSLGYAHFILFIIVLIFILLLNFKIIDSSKKPSTKYLP